MCLYVFSMQNEVPIVSELQTPPSRTHPPDFLPFFHAAVLPVSFQVVFLGSPLSSHVAVAAGADAQLPLEL